MRKQPLVVRFPGAFRSFFPEIRALWAEEVPDIPLEISVSQPSGLLAEAVLEGEAADVLFSASLAYLDLLNEIGVCEPPVVIARNRLAIAVRYEWADRVQMLADALEPGPRLGVPQPITDPCVQYVRRMLAEAGLVAAFREKVQRGEVVHTRGSPALLDLLLQSRIDLALLYASELRHADRTVLVQRELGSPLDLAREIRFGGAVVMREGQARPEARAFLALKRGPKGQTLLVDQGFLPVKEENGDTRSE